MNRFDNDIPASAQGEIIKTVLCIAVMLFFLPGFGPMAGLIPGLPLLGFIAYTWWDFYNRMVVTVIRIYHGEVTVRWRNRNGKEVEVSREVSSLVYKYGETGSYRNMSLRFTLNLLEIEGDDFLSQSSFMEIVDEEDGWERSCFRDIENAFKGAGIMKWNR